MVSEMTTHGTEGAILGGATGTLAASNKNETLLYSLIGALLGGMVGKLLKEGVPKLAAVKEDGKWSFQKIELPR
jgi:hypothetical protein